MISVIIPAYNREATIERSAKSVLNQTYEDLELIIVDDCSTNKTVDVINSLKDPRVRCIKHTCNQGACVARNTGIANAKGDYIAFQDSDDSWRPNKLELQMDCMQEYSTDICFCCMERHNYPEKIEKIFPTFERGIIDYKTLLTRSYISTQTLLAKRKVFEDIKFNEKLRRMQDFDWVIRAGQKYAVSFENSAFVDVYLQNDSISQFSKKGCNLMVETSEYLIKEYSDIASDNDGFRYYLLEQIALNKVRLNRNASKELWSMYTIQKTPKNLIKAVISKVGLLNLIYKHRQSCFNLK